MRFQTFDEVAKWYADTKPIISKNHTKADDVRPIGERRYKWARIVKVDDNTYALTDGSWSEMSFNGSNPNQAELNRKTAPILWERKPDGDYISVRGCMGGGYSISRYQFYNNYLPRGMWHAENTRQGQHWIEVHGTRYVLPKSEYRYDYATKTLAKYEDKSLVFKCEGDKFVRVGEVEVKTKRIDKERKATVKPLLKKFNEWFTAIAPILQGGYSARHDYAKTLEDGGICVSAWSGIHKHGFYPEKVVEVLSNEEHECRVALAGMCLYWLGVTECPTKHEGHHIRTQNEAGEWNWQYVEGRDFTPEEANAWYIKEAKRIKASYNRSMNQILDLFATETV